MQFLKKLFNNRIFQSIATVGVISLGIKLLAFYKETLIASTYGLSLTLDTFLIAILLPGFIKNVFIGSLNNIFVPNYITEKTNGGNLGSFQAVMFLMVTGIALFFILLVYLSTDVFIDIVFPNKSPEYYSLVRQQIYIVIPSLIFMGLNNVMVGLIEIKGKFFIANIAGVFFILTTILFLFFAKVQLGNLVLAWAFLIGTILTFIYLLIQGKRLRVIFLSKPLLNEGANTMIKQIPHKLTAAFFSMGNNFVDKYFAAQLAIGAIGAINYGMKIPNFALAIIMLSVGKVLLPHFSKLVNTDLNKAYEQLLKIIKGSFFIAIIICIILYIYTPEIIAFALERNEFTPDDTIVVSKIQRILLIYIPFAFSGRIISKFLTTINENKFMAKISFVSFLLNIILNIILINKYGIYGLAIGTTIVMILRTLTYFIFTIKKRNRLIRRP